MALNLQKPISALHLWLTHNEPAIREDDTVLLANVGDMVVCRHGRGYFVGTVTEIYADSFDTDFLTVEWYGSKCNVCDDSVVSIIRQ